MVSVNPYVQNASVIKFGKITAADFNITSPVIDTNTNAVVVANIGFFKIEGNRKGNFSLIFIQIKRIKILNKKAFEKQVLKAITRLLLAVATIKIF